jgi:CheY-like chemotaxis protein
MNESILLVEDEQVLRTTLSDRLRGEGYVVETAVDGPEGFEKLFSTSCYRVAADLMSVVIFDTREWQPRF